MTASRTVSERVAALRARAAALGLKRLEIYAHPLANLEPWQVIIAALRYMEESFSTGRLKP